MPIATARKTVGGPFPLNNSLLDTDILSEIGKGIDPIVVKNATAYQQAFGHYTFSAISVMEVVRGFQKSQNLRRLKGFIALLPSMEVISFEESDGLLAGKIVGDLERTGQPIGLADPMIAAVALQHGLDSSPATPLISSESSNSGIRLILLTGEADLVGPGVHASCTERI